MQEKNITARIGNNFSEELENIKETRLEEKTDKKRKSTKRLTNLIVKHKRWKEIKKDLIEVNLEK